MTSVNSSLTAGLAQNLLNLNPLKSDGSKKASSTSVRSSLKKKALKANQQAQILPFRSQTRVMAQRDAGQAVSVLLLAEAGMDAAEDALEQMQDLSREALEDDCSRAERQAMQFNLDALKNDIERLVSDTTFSGVRLLDGSAHKLCYQVGESPDDTVWFEIDSLSCGELGKGLQSVALAAVDERQQLLQPIELEALSLSIPASIPVDVAMQAIDRALADEGFEVESLLDASRGGLLLIGHADELDALLLSADGRERLSVRDVSVQTRTDAAKALIVLDEAMAQVEDQRMNVSDIERQVSTSLHRLTQDVGESGNTQPDIEAAGDVDAYVERFSEAMVDQGVAVLLAQASRVAQYSSVLT